MSAEPSVLKGPWSYSRATACSRALYLEKEVKAPPEPRPERFVAIDRRDFGSLLHEGSELNLGSVVGNSGWLNSRDLCQNLLTKYGHLSPIAGEIERRFELFRTRFRMEKGMELAERDAVIRTRMLGSEMKLAVDRDGKPCSFEDCDPKGWRAIIDYAEDQGDKVLLIIDFKNRPAIFANGELLLDEQLSGYLDLVLKHFPDQFEKFRIGIYYFEFGYTQIVDIDIEQVHANVARLHARAAHKESMDEERAKTPEPGFGKCQYCDYLHSCKAGKELMAGGALAVTDVEQGKQLAQWVLVQGEKIAAAKKALKIFTGEHGPIELDDKTMVGHAVSLDGEEYDKDKTLRILKELIGKGKIEGKLSDFTSLSLDAVKKAAKDQEVYEALEPARSPKTSQKFDFYRPQKKKGVRTVKEGRKETIHPEDAKDFVDEQPRKARGRVKSGARKKES